MTTINNSVKSLIQELEKLPEDEKVCSCYLDIGTSLSFTLFYTEDQIVDEKDREPQDSNRICIKGE